MIAGLRRHLRLWRRFIAQAVVRDTHYRVHFVTTLVVGVVQLMLALVPVWLLFGYAGTIGGWSRNEAVALTGMHQIATGLLAAFVAPNLTRMTRYIADGELDLVLVRPVSAQFFLTLRWVNLAELGNVVTGAVVAAIALTRQGSHPTLTGVVQATLLLGVGCVLLTCAWSALAFTAFWLQSVDPVSELFAAAAQAGRYPLPIFPTAVRAVLTFAFPVAIATTLPAQALTRGIGWLPVLGGVAFALIALAAIRAYWRRGLRSYASVSS